MTESVNRMKSRQEPQEMSLEAAARRRRAAEVGVADRFLGDARALVAKLELARLEGDELRAERDRLKAFAQEVAELDRGDGTSLCHASVDYLAQRARDALAGPTRPRDEVVAADEARRALEAASKTAAERAADEAAFERVVDGLFGPDAERGAP